ncbi:monooxygenase [Herbaspirillum rubrisubalbicans]|uniref:Monooxygenase n=1 Tax=Herbaspirillum rubrisubalbicans TaxID=80842 RepID=A0ABX9BWG9_9BURK|nr:bifunctional 3-(3-hydroxy-phenyl)propionate/3-hydroxycinnamic acid hydroxylase [Herbaspirillum rubrisubalbicans]RAM62226.1 monooxygenase [Herbaspirillum rubrisubalbicans]RAN50059.1 monooxygenase [Herbaspirillum rubrisubalbicans]
MDAYDADVTIIGYGPVSRILAIMLGKKGHSVIVVEREKVSYPLPRAVCMDHEIRRVMMANGMAQSITACSAPSPRYQWFNQKWDMLLDIDWTVESISGGPEAYFFFQPALEAAMHARVADCGTVEIRLNQDAISFEQDEQSVSLTTRDRQTGEQHIIRTKYLIGADGANSMVRRHCGIAWEDRGFKADWLVVDVELNDGVVLDIPSAGQHCNPSRPTTFVPGGIRNGRPLRRWEFMCLPDETKEDLNNPEFVWHLLQPWVTPQQAQMVRHAVYTFRSLVASRWQDGRVFIAGDAAHLMPPFMGQGMCSGIRDAVNLAWRLDLVLTGLAEQALLADYERERKPHVTQIIDISVHLGKIVCVPDQDAAAARDQAFLDGTAPPPPAFPFLAEGSLWQDSDIPDVIGHLAPHTLVKQGARHGRLDDIVGTGFVLLARNKDALHSLSGYSATFLEHIGAYVAYLGEPSDAHALQEEDDKIRSFFDANQIAVALIRPDFYIYGAVTRPERLDDMVRALAKTFQYQVRPLHQNGHRSLTAGELTGAIAHD